MQLSGTLLIAAMPTVSNDTAYFYMLSLSPKIFISRKSSLQLWGVCVCADALRHSQHVFSNIGKFLGLNKYKVEDKVSFSRRYHR